MKTKVNRKDTKLPVSWNSKIPKQYKRNMLLGDLHRAKKISSNFVEEKKTIKTKYIKAEFPLRFINSIVNSFEEKEKNEEIQQDEEDELIIPSFLFREETDKTVLFVELPFCELNQKRSKTFIKKFN